jgi:hypothetical protein
MSVMIRSNERPRTLQIVLVISGLVLRNSCNKHAVPFHELRIFFIGLGAHCQRCAVLASHSLIRSLYTRQYLGGVSDSGQRGTVSGTYVATIIAAVCILVDSVLAELNSCRNEASGVAKVCLPGDKIFRNGHGRGLSARDGGDDSDDLLSRVFYPFVLCVLPSPLAACCSLVGTQ